MKKKYSIEKVFKLIGEECLLQQNQMGRVFYKEKDIMFDGGEYENQSI